MINDKVRLYSEVGRALVEAKESGGDPYAAIEAVLPWTEFEQSATEATQLARPAAFDHLQLIEEQYSTLRRYTPEFLDVLKLKAVPAAQAVLDAIDVVREMNMTGARKVPEGATVAFVKPHWKPLVITSEGIDRRLYEICALYLLPPDKFSELRHARTLPIAINPDLDQYLLERVLLLNEQLATVNQLAQVNGLPDAIIMRILIKVAMISHHKVPSVSYLKAAANWHLKIATHSYFKVATVSHAK